MPRIGRIRRAPQLDRRSPPGPLRLIGRRISHLPPPSVLALLYLTLVLIGSSNTRVMDTSNGPRVYTPRGYAVKMEPVS